MKHTRVYRVFFFYVLNNRGTVVVDIDSIESTILDGEFRVLLHLIRTFNSKVLIKTKIVISIDMNWDVLGDNILVVVRRQHGCRSSTTPNRIFTTVIIRQELNKWIIIKYLSEIPAKNLKYILRIKKSNDLHRKLSRKRICYSKLFAFWCARYQSEIYSLLIIIIILICLTVRRRVFFSSFK